MFQKCLEKKKKRRMEDHEQKNQKTERARGLGWKTRQETGNENQTPALRFQTLGWGIRHPKPVFRGNMENVRLKPILNWANTCLQT